MSIHDAGEKTILNDAFSAISLTSGEVMFVAGDVLFVQRLNESEMELEGDRSPIAKSIASFIGIASYTVARDGSTLLYQTGAPRATDLLIIDRNGREVPTRVPRASAADPYVSRDGRHAAFAISTDTSTDVWHLDMNTGLPLRLTTGGARTSAAIWSPDAKQLVVTINSDLYLMSPSGGGPELLLQTGQQKFASDWSPDGRFIAFSEFDSETRVDVKAISVADRQVFSVVSTPYDDFAARFSPDGQWIAYGSSESGQAEVYVQRFPDGAQKIRVSENGGVMPAWSSDGRELFYISNGKLVSSRVARDPELRVSASKPLFDLHPLSTVNPAYAPLPDGERFLVARKADTEHSRVANVVLNWTLLRKN